MPLAAGSRVGLFGAPRVLFEGSYQSTDIPNYDVTANGQRFLMVKSVPNDADTRTIRVIEHWHQDVAQRLAGPR